MVVKQPETKLKRAGDLPKFDSTRGLIIGITFSLVVFGINLWSLILSLKASFFPIQLANILGVVLGVGLAVHSLDMIGYYRRHGRLGTDQRR